MTSCKIILGLQQKVVRQGTSTEGGSRRDEHPKKKKKKRLREMGVQHSPVVLGIIEVLEGLRRQVVPWLRGVALPMVWEEAIGATDSHIHDEIELKYRTTDGAIDVVIRISTLGEWLCHGFGGLLSQWSGKKPLVPPTASFMMI